ncbi:hypothetical protein BDP27DRAFT_1330015 [Rhodocollybia butyracea]|uniref:DUF6533 domain-containing protein n=1 Tax=Rhodocollybia butyracea TaxID=206335 RepID=A0A9P5PJ92_9AGAR|nr:hypothetical protein BDP27DRAFT_1330015 [Rhodocollybia butyracea]
MDSSADIAEQIFIHQCLQVFGFSFLVWDHIISLEAEVRYIWAKAKSRSACMFFFLRYFALLGNISVNTLSFLNMSPQSCEDYGVYREFLLVFTQTVVCGILTLRIYALYQCKKKVLILMCVSACMMSSFVVWFLINQKSTVSPVGSGTMVGCHLGTSHSTAIRIASAWEALFLYDTTLFLLTLIKTYRSRRQGVLKIDLLSLILRDGSIYFALMALANLSNILTFYFAPLYLRGGLSTFATCVSVTMMSRLMLNLHESTDEGLYSTTVNFDTMIFVTNPPASAEVVSFAFSTIFEEDPWQ